MISNQNFNLDEYPLKGAVQSLNDELAALGIRPGEPDAGQAALYGEGVYGVRFNGNTRLGALVDTVSRTMWPQDAPAVAPHTANKRDHLLVCANYPGEKTEALQFFTTFQPGQSPWGQEEEGELRRVADEAVNIDSSAKLKADESRRIPVEDRRIPPMYQSPVSAYLINLYWLVEMQKNSLAVIEVNRAMKHSLSGKWGIGLGEIDGAKPRKIGGEPYERLIIDPSSPENAMIVDMVRACPPTTFKLAENGLTVPDNNRSNVAA